MKPPLQPPHSRTDDRAVFVSYTTRDEEVKAAAEMAEQLNGALRAEGIGSTVRQNIWWDKDQIGSFEGSSGRLAQILRSGIANARCLVSIQTATYPDAPWCCFECDTARAFGVKLIDVRPEDLTSPPSIAQLTKDIRDAINGSAPPETSGIRTRALQERIPVSSEEVLVACELGARHAIDPEMRSFWAEGLQDVKVKGWRRPKIAFRRFVASHYGYHMISGATLFDLRKTEILVRRESDSGFDGPCWTDRFFGRGTQTSIRDVLAFDVGPLKQMRQHIEDMI